MIGGYTSVYLCLSPIQVLYLNIYYDPGAFENKIQLKRMECQKEVFLIHLFGINIKSVSSMISYLWAWSIKFLMRKFTFDP